jgi:hypothetical protein
MTFHTATTYTTIGNSKADDCILFQLITDDRLRLTTRLVERRTSASTSMYPSDLHENPNERTSIAYGTALARVNWNDEGTIWATKTTPETAASSRSRSSPSTVPPPCEESPTTERTLPENSVTME